MRPESLDKKPSARNLVRVINISAFVVAMLVALGLPGLYFLEECTGEHDEITALATAHAAALNQTLRADADRWPLNQPQLVAQVASLPNEDDDETSHSILGTDRRVLASTHLGGIPSPLVGQEVPLYRHGEIAGYYRVERNVQAVLSDTFIVACGALLLALVIAVPLRAVPLRALRRALRDLEEEREKALITLQSIGDAVITTDARMRVEYLNPIAEQLTGWTTAQARGVHMDAVFQILDESSRAPAVNPIAQCLATNSIVELENHTILVRKTDNAEFHIEDSAAPIRRADGTILGAVMVFHDVSARNAAQKRLHHIAFHDELTDLPNRALFQKNLALAIGQARASGKHIAVLFMDLDRFKLINDSLGHGVGDELLVLVAKRLSRCVRDDDTVSRMGGDEFTAVLGNLASADNAALVAAKIFQSLSLPFVVQGQELRISASIGITIFPQDGEDIDVLLKNADTAMYQAKNAGRSNYKYYASSMNAKALEKLRLQNALHTALANDELFLEYQPKLDLKSGQIVGAEALLRWQSPELGRVMPSDFIPILEDSGKIVEVGAWVLQSAIVQGRRWMDMGYALVISVNASARQFGQEDLMEQVAAMLGAAQLPPRLLQIEVTESLLMDEAAQNQSMIRKLNDFGVKVSLDDFGTGYSSLSYLRRFPISELKIDRSFILDMFEDNTAQKVLKTIIDLGHALDMTVTAEGVETEQQRARLAAMGCDQMQGYLLSQPLGVAAFEALVKAATDAAVTSPV